MVRAVPIPTGVKMAFRPQPGEIDSPTWADVAELINYVEAEVKCKVTWEMGASAYGKRGLVGSVFASRAQVNKSWYVCQRLDLRWPTSSARTMPAQLVRTLWRLLDAMHAYDESQTRRETWPEATLPPPPA